MGVWRDPRCGRSHQPKKRARYEHGSLEATNERRWQPALPKKIALHLDDRPANGCHRNTNVQQIYGK
jgi:hypothetical protein